MSVAVAGSGMHFIIALVCMFAFFVGVGVSQDDRWEVDRMQAFSGEGLGPAGEAGLQIGDRIVAFNGQPIVTWEDLRGEIGSRSPGDQVTLTVDRNGTSTAIDVRLGQTDDGTAYLGVGPVHPPQRQGVVTAATTTVTEFATYSQLTVEAIGRIFSPAGLSNFFGMAVDTARTPAADEPVTAPNFEDQGDRVLSIYGAARLGTQMTDTGVAGLLIFLALINVFIGIFNLIPLLPLDGGHVAIATYERIRELLSRSTTRYHADVTKLIPLTYLVIFVMVGVGLIALYLDIADPINLPG